METKVDHNQDKLCKGCNVNHHCTLLSSLNMKECPCAICLVKPMCNDQCDAYDIYEDLILTWWEKNR